MSGPKPTPTAILRARGSHRAKGRTDYNDPLFPLGMPTPPKWLCAEAKEEFRRVAKIMFEARVLSKVHRASLTAYAVAWARFAEAEKKIAEMGAVLTSPKGTTYSNPWVWIASGARGEMVKILADFGATPSAAGKVQAAPEEPDEEENEKARFFKDTEKYFS